MSLKHMVIVVIFQCLMYQIVFPNDTILSEKKKLLSNALKAFDMSLDFFKENVKEMNLDAIFGLRISQGVLETTLSTFGQVNPILARIIALKAKTTVIIEDSIPYLKSSNIKYYNQVSYSVKNQWKLVRPFRRLTNTGSIDVNEQDVLTKYGYAYQPCMEAIFGSGNSEPCNVTSECWSIMSRMDKIGYSLTHQALYFMFAQQIKGCSSILSKKLHQANIKGGFNYMYDVICSSMYPQMTVLENNNKNIIQLDLYFEQALICGLLGYEDFLSKTRLLHLLRSQFPSGCYGDPKENPKRILTDTVNQGEAIRPKRTKKVLADGCEAHISGIASALLSMYIRWLVIGSHQVQEYNILDTIQN